MFLLSETGERSDCLFCFGVDFFKYHIRTYRVIKFFPCTSYGQIPRNFTNHSSLPTVQWLRMIDNVGYPVRCLVSSLNNHKLLQFLQHSRTPLFVIFHFPITSNSMKHSRLSISYMKRRSQTVMMIGNKVYWTWLLWFLFIMKVVRMLAITSTWSIDKIAAFVFSRYQVTLLKVLFDKV